VETQGAGASGQERSAASAAFEGSSLLLDTWEHVLQNMLSEHVLQNMFSVAKVLASSLSFNPIIAASIKVIAT
jgi:hypothetical protein